MDKVWEPADIFAVLLVLVYAFLAWRGVTTMLNGAILIIVGYYFGRKTTGAPPAAA